MGKIVETKAKTAKGNNPEKLGQQAANIPVTETPVDKTSMATNPVKKKLIDETTEQQVMTDAEPGNLADDAPISYDSAVQNAGEPLLMAQASGSPSNALAGSEPTKTAKADGSTEGTGNWLWWLGGIAVVGAGAGIAAGSGGGGSSSTPNAVALSGRVTDGPVEGATIYNDVNKNGVFDAGDLAIKHNGVDIKTDANGNFEITQADLAANGIANIATLKLVTHGGTDTVTGAAVTVDFSAPEGYRYLNPITSVIASYMEANPTATATQAEAAVETALGLPNLDFATTDLNATDTPLAVQQTAAVLATTAVIAQQSAVDADPFAYLSAEMGTSGGSTDTLVTALTTALTTAGDTEAAAQLTETVTAVESATTLDSIGAALNNTFYAELLVTGTVAEGQTLDGTLGLGNTTGLDVTYQWQESTDGTTWTDIPNETSSSHLITAADIGDRLRLRAIYTDTAGATQTVYSTQTTVVADTDMPPVINDASLAIDENLANTSAVYDVSAVGGTTADTDVDGQALAYSITAGNSAGAFAINSATGAITVADATKLDFETTTSFNLTVQANDGSKTDTAAITINLNDLNDNSPVITSGGTGSVAENAATSTVIYDAATDTGTTITYSLKAATGDVALLNIDSSTGEVRLNNAADYETKASLSFTVIASDGTNSVEQPVTVSVTDLNDNSPVITTGGTGSVAENAATSTVIYDAAATDADAGTTITYSLKAATGDVALLNIDSSTGQVRLNNSADYESKASLSFTVIASDGTNSVEQPVTVSVTDLNDNTPVITSGGTGSVAENTATSTVIYDAAATDADAGTTITYSLKAATGDVALLNIDSSTGQVRLNNAADFETKASYSFTVIASDGTNSVEQPVVVTVTNVNEAPAISSNGGGASASIVATENQTAVTTVTATDVDASDTQTYSISGGADAALFAIDSSTGVLTFQAAPNYEAPADGGVNNVYDVQVTVTDGGTLTDVQNIAVNVTNANEAPAISSNGGGASAALNAAENQTAVTTVTATDVDASDTQTYSISGGADAALFAIDSSTGVLTFQAAPNYEAPADGGVNNIYDVQVTVTDTAGLTDVQDIAVTVTNVNDNPVSAVTDSNVAANSVTENAANGTAVGITAMAADADAGATISYSLDDGIGGGSAGGRFAINAASGVVTVADGTLLDYESAPSHDVTVLATSSDGSTNNQTFTINLTNVNDNPVSTVTDSNVATNSVAENAAIGTAVGITALAADADAGATISYSLDDGIGGGNAGGRFAINAASGVVTVADGTLLDYESATSHDITVLATSSDGSTNSQTFTINLTNVNDNPVSAVTDSNVATNSVAENAAIGTAVGITALAADADAGATISYSLDDGIGGSNAGGRFAINAASGVVTVADGTLLDYETATSHDVTVLATSSDGSTNSQTFTINLTNVNEHFVVEASGAWIDLNTNGVKDAGDTTAADFTPGTGNVDLTAISGVIHFNNAPTGDLSLAGFGVDDRIEIDAQAFIDNGHNVLNILSIPDIRTLDEFRTTGGGPSYTSSSISNPYSFISNLHATFLNFIPSITATRQTGTRYKNYNSSSGVSTTFWASISLNLRSNSAFTQRNLRFVSSSTSAGNTWQLASGLPTNILLQDMVDFVNLPTLPATVHVVVERNGAAIDFDGDGVRDNGENRLAQFGAGGNADLAAATPVVIHFNDVPQSALDLTGFGVDDKIEFDVASLQGSSANVLNPTAAAAGLVSFTFGALSLVGYNFTWTSSTTSFGFTTLRTAIRVQQATGTRTDFAGNSHSNVYGLSFTKTNTTISGRTNGLVAYWNDSGNALNNKANLLPDYVSGTGSNYPDVLAALNANHYPGLVEFVWPVHVVVDDQAGNVATFIDANANGVRDGGEDTLALLGQDQATVDAFNTAAGTSYGSQAVDLASEQVSIHYNDLPTGAWVPDLTGFNGNDRIEIDLNAMKNNNDTITRSAQTTVSKTTPSGANNGPGVNAFVTGISAAVFVSGSSLKFGHYISSTSFTPSPVFYRTFFASNLSEGAIATNASGFNQFNQVDFVYSGVL